MKRGSTTSAKVHPTEGTDGWCTPKWLAEALGPFDLDPCSNARGHVKARIRFMVDHHEEGLRDGLEGAWMDAYLRGLSVFCNPPYSDVGPWAAKLAAHEGPWVALLKLDPTTKWWATLMPAAPTVAPFRKRIKFETDQPGPGMTANFPSVLVYSAWRPPIALRPHLWLTDYA